MKNNRFRGWFLHSLLIIAVLISLIFTVLIWVTPGYFQRLININSTTKSTSTTTTVNEDSTAEKKNLANIYIPTSITATVKKENYQLMSNRIDVVNSMVTVLEGAKFTDIKAPKEVSRKEYLKLLQTNNAYQLNYGSAVSFEILKNYVKTQPENSSSYSFDRIVLSFDGKTVYFLDDADLKVYTAKLTGVDLTKLKSLINGKNIKKMAISYHYQGDNLLTYYDTSLTIPRYSYLYNKENAGMYVTRLLGAEKSGSSSLTTREHGNSTVYADNSGQKLSVNNKTGVITYTDYLTDDTKQQNWTLSDYLSNSFTQLEQLGVSLNDVRYSEYDQQEKNVIYRSYIDGFPVISARDFGTYQIQNRVRSKKIVFSQCSLQVPVPAAGKAVTLKATKEVLAELSATNKIDVDKIEDIEIGYEVTQNGTASLVTDLTPTYFVKYNNSWINYEDLLTGETGSSKDEL